MPGSPGKPLVDLKRTVQRVLPDDRCEAGSKGTSRAPAGVSGRTAGRLGCFWITAVLFE